MGKPLNIGIAGLGTVGTGVLHILDRNADLLTARGGRPMRVTAVSARDRAKDRGVDLSGALWCDDPLDMVDDPAVDVIVEVIGGAEGVARLLVERALAVGKPVVTANKALLAEHGGRLAEAAAAGDTTLGYEAAVAGGIPVIKSVREALAANRISSLHGILNGTCNYILTEMRQTGRNFDEVLKEAQELGYAEADPTFDVDGIDAAHKLAILAGLAFNGTVRFEDVHVEGIRKIGAEDIAFAEELGFRIKLLGIARADNGEIELRVHPALVRRSAPIAAVDGVFNAVVVVGDFVGEVMLEGAGAGAGPTASAIVGDLLDVARGIRVPVLGTVERTLKPLAVRDLDRHRGAYYLRLMVKDRPGVIAAISAHMRDQDISLESLIQRGRSSTDAVPVVITTHETSEAAIRAVLAKIRQESAVVEEPHMIRIEPFNGR
ncbi:MAG: homoserine dehydrogenase [Azospirillaceae bacterium]